MDMETLANAAAPDAAVVVSAVAAVAAVAAVSAVATADDVPDVAEGRSRGRGNGRGRGRGNGRGRAQALQKEAALATAQQEHARSSAAAVREALALAPESESVVAAALFDRIAAAEADAVRVCEQRAVNVDSAFVALDDAAAIELGGSKKSKGGKGGKGGKAGRSHAARKTGVASLRLGASILKNESVRLLRWAPALAEALGSTERLDAVLMAAVRDNNPELVHAAFIDPAARVTIALLENAVSQGKSNALRALLAHPSMRERDDATLLARRLLIHVAVPRGRASVVTVLLESGLLADADALAQAVNQALALGHIPVVRALMFAERFDLTAGLVGAIRLESLRGVKVMLKDARFAGAPIRSAVIADFVSSTHEGTLRAVKEVISDVRFVASDEETRALLVCACRFDSSSSNTGEADEKSRIVRALLVHPRVVLTFDTIAHAVTAVLRQDRRWNWKAHVCTHFGFFVVDELLTAATKLFYMAPSEEMRNHMFSHMRELKRISSVEARRESGGSIAPCNACFVRMAKRVAEMAVSCGM